MLFLTLFSWLRGVAFEAPNDSGGGTPPPPPAAPPAGDPPAGTPPNTPNLVDVTAVDEQGRRLWYSWQDHKKNADEAASWRKKYQDLKKTLGDSLQDGETPPAGTPPAPPASPTLNLADENRRLLKQNAVLGEMARTTADRAAFVNPALAVRLIDFDQLTMGEDGTIQGVAEAVAALAKDNPYLLVTAAGGATPPPRVPNPPRQEALTIETIRTMKPEEILARQKEVDEVLAKAYTP